MGSLSNRFSGEKSREKGSLCPRYWCTLAMPHEMVGHQKFEKAPCGSPRSFDSFFPLFATHSCLAKPHRYEECGETISTPSKFVDFANYARSPYVDARACRFITALMSPVKNCSIRGKKIRCEVDSVIQKLLVIDDEIFLHRIPESETSEESVSRKNVRKAESSNAPRSDSRPTGARNLSDNDSAPRMRSSLARSLSP